MKVFYRCPKCQKLIDFLEVEEYNEKALGLNILTEDEKEDIIEVEYDNIYIDLTCDECLEEDNWVEMIHNVRIH
ncbi:anti-sigma-F factor Fin [Halonatronum saccharophilum]|uniref:anti-sigma-F factor Fin n=1 Tax=Halonatronum saccharophilum TaxID=150060 RepID=UPI0004801E1F|nr:anti-sigma-F factor Fin [Halonatronum saccharophilum]